MPITRRAAKSATEKQESTNRKISEYLHKENVATKMAGVEVEREAQKKDEDQITLSQLNKTLMCLQKDIHKSMQKNDENFAELRVEITTIKTKAVENEKKLLCQEGEIASLKVHLNDLTETVNTLEKAEVSEDLESLKRRVRKIEQNELEKAIYARKYNLLVYGVEGRETDPKKTESIIRDFAKKELCLDEEFSDSFLIGNIHRLPKKSTDHDFAKSDTDPIIIKFLRMSDRDAFLKASKNIPMESKKRVRTHLPYQFSKERAKLARRAYEMRQEKWQARVRERGSTIWLESRRDPKDEWQRVDVRTLDDVLDLYNK